MNTFWGCSVSVHCVNLPEILALVRPPPFLAMPGFLRILLTGQPFLYIIQSTNTFTHFQNSVLYRSICVNQHLHFTLLVNLAISKKKLSFLQALFNNSCWDFLKVLSNVQFDFKCGLEWQVWNKVFWSMSCYWRMTIFSWELRLFPQIKFHICWGMHFR